VAIIMDIDIKQQVKEILLKENISMTDLVSKLNENKSDDEKTSVSSLSNKLTRGTIKYSEMVEIFDTLGYDIALQKRYNIDTQSSKTISSGIVGATTGFLLGGIPGGIVGSLIGIANEEHSSGSKWFNPFTWVNPETKSLDAETTITHEIDVTKEQSIEMRLSFEMSINWEVSELINKLIEYFTSNYVIDDKIAKIFKNYLDDDDILAVNTRLEKYALPISYLLTQYPLEGEIFSFITSLRNIYSHGGLSNLSNDDLNILMKAIRYYNDNDFIEKEN
jgi:hypothetical protein